MRWKSSRLLLLRSRIWRRYFNSLFGSACVAFRCLLGVDAVEEVMRGDFLVAGQQARIVAQQGDEGMDLRLGGFGQSDLVVALIGWEKVVGGERLEFCAHAIHPPDALHHAAGIPRDVVIDDRRGAMEVYAFREDIGGDENAVIVAGSLVCWHRNWQ